MFAVSKRVMPSSSAASITARVCSRSQRRPKLFVPSPTSVTSGPPSPSCRVRMLLTLSADDESVRPRVDDDERLRRPGQRDVQLAQPLLAVLGDRGGLDDDDVVELEPLRLARR